MRLLTLMVLAGAAGACAPKPVPVAGAPQPAESAAVIDARPVVLQVENHNSADITIHAIVDGHRSRLGVVTTAATERFDISRLLGLLREVRLVAETSGGRTGGGQSVSSDRVAVQPGQTLIWTLESALRRSVLEIR